MLRHPRVFVYEYLSGGGFIPSAADPAVHDEAAAAELLPLGLTMRDAMAADLCRLGGCLVTLASSARVRSRAPSGATEALPRDGETALDFVARQAALHDAAWIVAPETGGLLARLAGLVGPARWIGCEAEAITLCTGKRATLVHLAAQGVLTPLAFEGQAQRWVAKPDDGAGCVATRVHASVERALQDGPGMTVEPWVEGEPLSVSLLCGAAETEVLAINRQRIGIADDGGLSFDGVDLNAIAVGSAQGQAIARLARQVGQAIPGLRGFVGIDLVWHAQRGAVLIEVNPRVTVAYAGLSAALGRNLAGEILAVRAVRRAAPAPAQMMVGWDIGGAHVKACLTRQGKVLEVVQWACPLWQGLDHLAAALSAAQARWPLDAGTQHAVTMTGEMVDLFEHREAGVQGIAALLRQQLPGRLRFFAGDAGWCGPEDAALHWEQIASANWLATAQHAAQALDEGLLLDIGSTTTDIIAFKAGRVLTTARSDVQRLATGELVYQGVVRTPLCALAPRIRWRGQLLNVMNEYFATVADVYRLTGELDAAHDLHPAADNAVKDLPATRKRLARMIGMDARDAGDDEWLGFAREWRAAQLEEMAGQMQRVIALHGLSSRAVLVGAGCGDFLVPELAAACGLGATRDYGRDLARAATPQAAGWARVCAPSVAVALLLDRELR